MYNLSTHFHFIGIGGIGMSAIAKVLIQQGYIVSGCDKNTSQKSVLDLQTLGCKISPEHNSTLCADSSINVLVYSTDISSDNPEFTRARERGIPVVHRSLVLAELMKRSFSIGVAGSHGKTTTTSLISHIFLETNQNPTVLVGGHLTSINSNAHFGSGKFLIAETDESDRSLLNLYPTIAVLTNIDLEHMNVYTNLQDVTRTFEQYLERIPFYGKAIVCLDDAQIQTLLPLQHTAAITYGMSPNAHWRIQDLVLEEDALTYTLVVKNLGTFPVRLNILGAHNALNSVAALAAAYHAGISLEAAIGTLATFAGVDRRFTYRGSYKNLAIFDDYGHHPTEIACTLNNARGKAQGKPVSVIFQPHRYTRTQSLWQEFIKLFAQARIDHLIITDLYSAHEKPLEGITSARMVEELTKLNPPCTIAYVPYEDSHASLLEYIQTHLPETGVLLLQGAGSVTKIAHSLLQK